MSHHRTKTDKKKKPKKTTPNKQQQKQQQKTVQFQYQVRRKEIKMLDTLWINISVCFLDCPGCYIYDDARNQIYSTVNQTGYQGDRPGHYNSYYLYS